MFTFPTKMPKFHNKLVFCEKLIDKSKHFYIGVSGGTDSIVFAKFLKDKNYNFSIIHINNKFTDKDDSMEASVVKFGQDFNIPVKVVVSEIKDTKESGKEAACRETRINAFKELNSVVLTGANLNDAVECHYMNFFRGCDHFYPMPVETKLEGSNSVVVRPFLLNDRKDIEEYAKENNLLQYIVEDPLNYDLSCKRAFIRHQVIPLIESRKNKNNGGLEVNLNKIVMKRIIEQYKKYEKTKFDN